MKLEAKRCENRSLSASPDPGPTGNHGVWNEPSENRSFFSDDNMVVVVFSSPRPSVRENVQDSLRSIRGVFWVLALCLA